MTDFFNPYKILGIPNFSSDEDIKRAWRSLSSKLHPDKGGDAEAFILAHSAYRIISDPKTKSTVDKDLLQLPVRNKEETLKASILSIMSFLI